MVGEQDGGAKGTGATRRGSRRNQEGVEARGESRGQAHAYATISFDCVITFRPGGISRVNKLHIFPYRVSLFAHGQQRFRRATHCLRVADLLATNSRQLFDPRYLVAVAGRQGTVQYEMPVAALP